MYLRRYSMIQRVKPTEFEQLRVRAFVDGTEKKRGRETDERDGFSRLRHALKNIKFKFRPNGGVPDSVSGTRRRSLLSILGICESPRIELVLVGHQEDLHLLLEADGSLANGGGGVRQRHGGAAIDVIALEAVERGPSGEGRLVAVGSLVTFNDDGPCRCLAAAGRGGAAPCAPDSRAPPLLLPRQHAPWSRAAASPV